MKPTPPLNLLLKQAENLYKSSFFANVIASHLIHTKIGTESTLTVHRNDQMLIHSLKHHCDANASVSQYYNVALQQFDTVRQILDFVYPRTADSIKFLDFACGYGRLSRLLSEYIPKKNLHVSEIQEEALRFVGEQFEIKTFPSAASPEDFSIDENYQVIWVASLFSHLPEHLFKHWLSKLYSLLTPDGILCFSVHDESLLQGTRAIPKNGILFMGESENDSLDRNIYGNTFVTEQFITNTITDTLPGSPTVYRLPKALAHEQDVYVLGGTSVNDLTSLDQFRRGPWGWVDERVISEGGLYLRGWAASIDDGVLDNVKITINGQVFNCATGQSRPDVVKAFNDRRLEHCGWEFQLTQQELENHENIEVTVSAISRLDERALLYAGVLTNEFAVNQAKSKQGALKQLKSWLHIIKN
ncbi:class I SAM-dependent methyltransferase [Gilvimarinus xylanilyticus]|uniref:Class I SAM-dependent methyltransferase n=1 Tax=Gilvimarinus xylanilyticus TaxID=2944139 RepID=A0A9X2I4N6_9GAMM|nr:class I SAM-dependent methyltransferase [Gilvimarinus xylanilyticus]MCP8899377.1 class I SAM-dependent methyltransferase [Gilvimarinus xylanilyticus]